MMVLRVEWSASKCFRILEVFAGRVVTAHALCRYVGRGVGCVTGVES